METPVAETAPEDRSRDLNSEADEFVPTVAHIISLSLNDYFSSRDGWNGEDRALFTLTQKINPANIRDIARQTIEQFCASNICRRSTTGKLLRDPKRNASVAPVYNSRSHERAR